MNYKSSREILNKVFDSPDETLKAQQKTEGEVLNMVYTEDGTALKVRVTGLVDSYSKTETDTLLADKAAVLHNHDTDYVKKSDVVGAFGNLNTPLLTLPLKKNLLTQQGQSVCTFTRASAATYADRYGVLKSVAADTPRFTADGLLIEGASTNLLTYSEQFDNAAWNKSECSVSANSAATTDPFGTSLADKIVESTVNSKHQIYAGISFTSGTAYTFSVYAKAAERTGISLSLSSAVFGASDAFFDLTAGTASGTGAAISKLANGWFRCSITKTATASASSAVYAMPTQGDNPIYTGDGASGLYVFGAQLEAMPFATSYITTTTASATRAGNNISILQADNVPYFGSDFTIVADVANHGVHTLSMYVLSGGWTLYLLYPSMLPVFAFNGQYVSSSTSLTPRARCRIAITKTNTQMKMYVNGVLAGTTALSSFPAHTSNMYVGSNNGTSGYFYGHISNLRFYDRALTAEEVRLA